MVRIVTAAMVVGLASAAPGRAVESCETLSYAEQEACWPRRLAAQAQQMKKLVEARIRRIGPDEVTDEARRDALAQVIRRSQAAWETFRDTECGELDYMMRRHILAAISNCKADLNAARLETLRRNVGP